MKLSLIIATYNRGAKLIRTLSSLTTQDARPEVWEVVIVNNNSSDNTLELCAEFAQQHPELNIKVVTEPRQGLSHARNCGIESSNAPIIAIIDDDEEVVSTFVSGYINLFESHPEVASAGGAVIPRYEGARPRWMSHLCEVPIANPIPDRGDARPFRQGKIPAGGNMAIRREIIDKYGSFDPELGRCGERLLGGEESNLYDRLRRAGEQVWFLPRVAIYHIIPDSKLEMGYLRQLWFNIGVSQRRRATIEGVSPIVILAKEAAKWGVTLTLALWWCITLNPSKGRYLIAMRRYITQGLIADPTKHHPRG